MYGLTDRMLALLGRQGGSSAWLHMPPVGITRITFLRGQVRHSKGLKSTAFFFAGSPDFHSLSAVTAVGLSFFPRTSESWYPASWVSFSMA